MHRNQLLSLLARYQAAEPAESAVVERFRAFVQTQPTCFDRALTIGHVTGSAWIVNLTGTRVLLTHHKKLDQWLQPGGHADGDPDVRAVALKEAEEETGLTDFQFASPEIFDLDIHLIPARGATAAHFHYDARFALQTDDASPYHVSAESHDLAWVALERLPEFTQEASMLRMARKWQKLQSILRTV